MDELSFEIPNTPENKAAMEELKKQCSEMPGTIYGQDGNGNMFPIMNITKHPDCPDGWYEAMVRRFLNLNDD